MEFPENDIMNSYQPIIASIKSFKGPDAYILDIIKKVSALPPKVRANLRIERVSDVTKLLSKVVTNRL